MRCLTVLCLLALAGCAVPAPYGGAPVLPSAPSNLSTMRQITGRADGIGTLQPEPGDIWAAQPAANPPPTQPGAQRSNQRPASSRTGTPLAPPPLKQVEGDFWRIP
jgi:hypothetical protein